VCVINLLRRERPLIISADEGNEETQQQKSLEQKSKKCKYGPRVIPPEWLHSHIPATQSYAAEDVMQDLLTFASTHLRVGGRLVYLLPTTYDDYTDADLPRHPRLRIVANSEEKLTTKYGRRLITMEKMLHPDNRLDYPDIHPCSYANVREKLHAANKNTQTQRKREQEATTSE
jgi:hypothetical protein